MSTVDITISGPAAPWNYNDPTYPFKIGASAPAAPFSVPVSTGQIITLAYVSGIDTYTPNDTTWTPAGHGEYSTGGGEYTWPSDNCVGAGYPNGSNGALCGGFANGAGVLVAKPYQLAAIAPGGLITYPATADGPITLPPVPAGATQLLLGLNLYENYSGYPATGSWIFAVTGSDLVPPMGPAISERSFACNGCFESTSAYGDVLKSLALSMAGFVVPPGDCWRIYAGAYVPPTVTLADPDCRGAIKADIRLSARDTCNGVKGQYIPGFLPINPLGPLAASPASPAWKKTDFPPVQRANYIAEDGGIILWKDIQLDFTISLWMAQRIARIILERLRRQVTVSLPAKLTGIALLAADVMQFVHPRWAAISPPMPETFQVSHTALRMEAQEDGVPAFGTDLVLRQTDAEVFEFAPPSSPINFGDYSSYGQTGIGAGNVE